MAVAKALQYFKGRSANEIFGACHSFRKTFRKGHFWSRGKFYWSVSNVGADIIYNYITGHRNKELQASFVAVHHEVEPMSLPSFIN